MFTSQLICLSLETSEMNVLDDNRHGEDLSKGLESVPVVSERSSAALAFPEFQVTTLSAVEPIYSRVVA